MKIELVSLLRAGVILYGGVVIGFGLITLNEWAQQLARRNDAFARAAYMLVFVHCAVLTFVTLDLAIHFHYPRVTWRMPLAFVIYTAKAYFLRAVRNGVVEEDRQALERARRDSDPGSPATPASA